METVFLSYTYHSHPDHEANLDRLRRYVVRTIEAMDLRVIDGVDVGGRPLDEALRKRIEGADALIALVTPQAGDAGTLVGRHSCSTSSSTPKGCRRTPCGCVHDLLPTGGLSGGNEYAHYKPGSELDVILKLMNTIAVWKREYGQLARVRIEPVDLVAQYDELLGDRCEFQVISRGGVYGQFKQGSLWPEPGAFYALLPKLHVGEKVRLRLRQGNKTWQSLHPVDPFVGGVRLEEKT